MNVKINKHQTFYPGKMMYIIVFVLFFCYANAGIYRVNNNWVENETPLKGDMSARVASILLANESMQYDGVLPKDSMVTDVQVVEDHMIIELHLSDDFLNLQLDEERLELMSRAIDLNLNLLNQAASQIHFTVLKEGQSIALSNFLNIPAVPDKPDDIERQSSVGYKNKNTPSLGFLRDKVLFISQAHGWIDYDDFREWSTQRGIHHQIVEDFVNSEGVNQYLLEYLTLAGAKVFALRERDMNSLMLIVDNDDPEYEEIGQSFLFNNSSANGFANHQAPYSSETDPFRDNGGSDRIITTSPVETAQAVWHLQVPEDGYYHVYVSYSGDGNRPTDAKYTVHHGGIETEFVVNQQRHRYIWNHLGEFYFYQNDNNHVRLSNQSSESNTTVSADAVRLGGGMGDVVGSYHGVVSGRPRWEEGAQTWTQYQGASSTIHNSKDSSARPRFADWEHYQGEDSAYISLHSNGASGTARGTNTYIYSSNPPNGSYDTTQSVEGSAELQAAIHEEIINDIHHAWDSNWNDRGKRSAYFAEVNPNNNDEMPAVLIEMAFHDNSEDAAALKDPAFRKLTSRAVYQGIVKYFAERDAIQPELLPEPPTHLSIKRTGLGEFTVAWKPPPFDDNSVLGDQATSYIIYRSFDGRNFDNGIEVFGESYTFDDQAIGVTHFIKMKAKNAGGLSLDSEVLGVHLTSSLENILIVNGFDRLDSGQLISENIPDIGGLVKRMYLRKMNRFDYIIEHANAMIGSMVGFDSAANEVVEENLLSMNDYSAIFWILGEESSNDESLSSLEQSALIDYLDQGGQLFISGAEIAWDLDHLGTISDQNFYHNVLMTAYWADDANVYQAESILDSPFSGLGLITFDDGSYHSYDVEYPDVLVPMGLANNCMLYLGMQSACTYTDNGIYKVLHLGFPFETIIGTQSRKELMEMTLDFFNVPMFDDLIFADSFE